MSGGWFDPEAIEQERQDADMLMAQYEEEGNRHARRLRDSEQARAEGHLATAAEFCPHSGGYPLASPAAEDSHDPNAGEYGWRCYDCGSRLTASPWEGGKVAVPCEVEK